MALSLLYQFLDENRMKGSHQHRTLAFTLDFCGSRSSPPITADFKAISPIVDQYIVQRNSYSVVLVTSLACGTAGRYLGTNKDSTVVGGCKY